MVPLGGRQRVEGALDEFKAHETDRSGMSDKTDAPDKTMPVAGLRPTERISPNEHSTDQGLLTEETLGALI